MSNGFNYTGPIDDSLFKKGDYHDDDINFVKLAKVINDSKRIQFNYKNFIGKSHITYTTTAGSGMDGKFDRMVGNVQTHHEIVDDEKPIYDESLGGSRKLDLTGALNKHKGEVALDFKQGDRGGLECYLNVDDEELQLAVHYYYVGADRVHAQDDKGRNIAFSVFTDNFADFDAFDEHTGRNFLPDNFRETIIEKFNEVILSNSLTVGEADWIYSVAPPFVLQQVGDEKLLEHLEGLLRADESSWFYDTSSAMVNLLMGFNDLKVVYDKFYSDPKFTKSIYSHINSDSGDNSKETYCNFLTVLCLVYQEIEDVKALKTVTLGGGYDLDSDLFFGESDSVRIKLTKSKTKRIWVPPHPTKDWLGGYYRDSTSTSVIFDEQFHPLDLVLLKDAETDQISVVPAIFVKRLSDIAEWNQIIDVLLTIVTILSMLTSVGLLVRGAVGLVRVMAVADLVIGSIDLLLKNDKLRQALIDSGPAGKWFVENWAIISLMSSMAIMSVQMAKGLIRHADDLIGFFTRQGRPKISQQIRELWKHARLTVKDLKGVNEFLVKRFNKMRFKYIQLPRIDKAWRASKVIRVTSMTKKAAQNLQQIRNAVKALKHANIAKAYVRVYDKSGKLVKEFRYMSASGRGNKIPKKFLGNHKQCSTPNEAFKGETKQFFDPTQGKSGGIRFKDSENKILRQFDDDLEELANGAGKTADDYTIEFKLETTYNPCPMCRREILLREEAYNITKFDVIAPNKVFGSQDLLNFLN